MSTHLQSTLQAMQCLTAPKEIQICWKQGRGFVRLGETGVTWNWQSDEGESIVRNRHGIQWALYKIRWSGMAGWKFCMDFAGGTVQYLVSQSKHMVHRQMGGGGGGGNFVSCNVSKGVPTKILFFFSPPPPPPHSTSEPATSCDGSMAKSPITNSGFMYLTVCFWAAAIVRASRFHT